MKTALLISTYNWKEALYLILKAVEAQSKLPDEVLFADDGSREDTKSLIDEFRKRMSIPVKHIWQEDKGFRKAMILNKAIAQTDADYIIQIDGDCIPHRHFVADHIENATADIYTYGTRINILKKYVDDVFAKELINFNFFSKEIKNKTRAIYQKRLAKLYDKTYDYVGKVRGCNISYWRQDILAINGYNEDFEGWGMEDSEMVMRLHNNGLKGRRLRNIGFVFHIYHSVLPKDKVEENTRLEKLAEQTNFVRCKNGIDKYL